MIVVTGGAGFIGSNLIKALNQQAETEILVVDNLTNGHKFRNLADCDICDFQDKTAFLNSLQQSKPLASSVRAIFHQGACSTTTEWDGHYMMHNNYEYSKQLLHYCLSHKIPFIYASSASVYGAGQVFKEDKCHENPINMYAYSKFLFDQYVRRLLPTLNSPVIGLRYFNVYGPREQHKASMASVAFHFNNQLQATGKVKLFAGSDGYAAGEQRRDFIYVDDVVKVNLWFLNQPQHRGLFNVGTGRSQTFNEVAEAVIAWHGHGEIEYIAFPAQLQGSYQSFTEADISQLRAAGYQAEFATVQMGVKAYLDQLNA